MKIKNFVIIWHLLSLAVKSKHLESLVTFEFDICRARELRNAQGSVGNLVR
jgi:hypothetical protein